MACKDQSVCDRQRSGKFSRQRAKKGRVVRKEDGDGLAYYMEEREEAEEREVVDEFYWDH